jgi:hypothetical protein
MIPLLSDWLIRFVQMIILLSALILVLLVPARHVLLPLWPWPVEERILVESATNNGSREFVAVQPGADNEYALISQDRPIMLVAIEDLGGKTIHGFLVGVRSEPNAALMERVPTWLFDHQPLPAQPSNMVLVVMLADESRIELTIEDVHRMYRPNQLSPIQRVILTFNRVVEIWQGRDWSFLGVIEKVDQNGVT